VNCVGDVHPGSQEVFKCYFHLGIRLNATRTVLGDSQVPKHQLVVHDLADTLWQHE
jgi:hypothetical protein